jgi:hypothetical protein
MAYGTTLNEDDATWTDDTLDITDIASLNDTQVKNRQNCKRFWLVQASVSQALRDAVFDIDSDVEVEITDPRAQSITITGIFKIRGMDINYLLDGGARITQTLQRTRAHLIPTS